MWSAADPIPRNTTASPARSRRERSGRYRLEGNRCEACDAAFFPARRVCPQCRTHDLVAQAFSATGRIVVAAEDHTPLIGHAGRARRPFAIVQLDDGPAVLTEIVDADEAEVQPGLEVELVIRKWRRESNGLYLYGYKFRPRRVIR